LFFLSACDTLSPIMPTATPTLTQTVTPLTVVYIGAEGYIWIWIDGVGSTQLPLDGNVQGVRISSDGKWIAYVRGGELFVFDLEHPDIKHNQPRIDRDYLSSLNSSGTFEPQITDFYFVTYLDDNQMVHHDLIVDILVTKQTGGMDIFRVSADDDNSYPSRLFAPGEGGEISPSPDGRWLVVSMANELLLTRSTGVDLKTISLFDDFPPYLSLGARGGPDIVWSDDSSGFFVVTPRYDPHTETLYGESVLWKVTAPDGNPNEVFHYTAQLFQPAYISPKGEKVIYQIDYGDMVSMMYVQGGVEQVLMTFQRDGAGFISWVPAPADGTEDSSCYVYWLGQRDWPFLACVNQPIAQLTDNSIFRDDLLRWVDENRFLYVNGLASSYKLYIDDRRSDTISRSISTIEIDPILPPYDFVP
jgi:WD40-like Beta Propeller Repeat